MAEVNGDRGHGYFVPADESAELSATMDCENLPSTCQDEAACQGFANAIAHNSGDDKESITAIWTPPSQMSGQVQIINTSTNVLNLFCLQLQWGRKKWNLTTMAVDFCSWKGK